MVIGWLVTLMTQTNFPLTTDNSTRKASLVLTQHVKVFSIYAPAEVEKSCFFSNLKPMIFMGSCSRNDKILAQMKVSRFSVWVPQGMDAQERCTCWLINVDVLRVLFPGEVQTKGSCKGRNTTRELLEVKGFFHWHLLKRYISKESKASFSKDYRSIKKYEKKTDPHLV